MARSVIPPGTAAARDFSSLAPTIPEFLLDACVGCMNCVNACPDSSILGIAQPLSVINQAIGEFAAGQPEPEAALVDLHAHFAHTTKYADVPARRGLEPAAFGIFVSPEHCKGCGECVEVCHALGYDALRMVEKQPIESSGVSTVDRYARDMRFFRSLPPTPPEYRNERALADIMLGDHAFGYVGGAGSCSGCGEATAIRMAGCRNEAGVRARIDGRCRGHRLQHGVRLDLPVQPVPDALDQLAVREFARRGASGSALAGTRRVNRTGDCGSSAAMGPCMTSGSRRCHGWSPSGADIKVLVLDTQVYSNTGGQASTALVSVVRSRSCPPSVASFTAGPSARKELGRIHDGTTATRTSRRRRRRT